MPLEGKAWKLEDFENGVPGVTMLTVVADDNDRTLLSESGEGVSKTQVYPSARCDPGAYPFLIQALSLPMPDTRAVGFKNRHRRFDDDCHA